MRKWKLRYLGNNLFHLVDGPVLRNDEVIELTDLKNPEFSGKQWWLVKAGLMTVAYYEKPYDRDSVHVGEIVKP